MHSYYVHFKIVGSGVGGGEGSTILDSDLPLCAQDIKAAKTRIAKDIGGSRWTVPLTPEGIDIDFIFELAVREETVDVQAQG